MDFPSFSTETLMNHPLHSQTRANQVVDHYLVAKKLRSPGNSRFLCGIAETMSTQSWMSILAPPLLCELGQVPAQLLALFLLICETGITMASARERLGEEQMR